MKFGIKVKKSIFLYREKPLRILLVFISGVGAIFMSLHREKHLFFELEFAF
jgi:hypothetical protein